MKKNLFGAFLAVLVVGLIAGTGFAGPENQTVATTAVTGQEDLESLVTRLREKIHSSDTQDHDCFGRSLAIDGDFLIAGAKGEDDGGSDSGAVYVFHRVDGDWTQHTRLKASDATEKDFFGFSVAIHNGLIAVGAWQEDEIADGAGAAYIFELQGDQWVETAKITDPNGSAYDEFGYDVSVRNGVVVVGARESDRYGRSAGAAFVYERQNGVWTQTASLEPPADDTPYQFGIDVAAGDDLMVIGALGAAMSAGSAHVYERQNGAWVHTARLEAEDGQGDNAFGYSVGVSGDTILVGAYGTDSSAESLDSGAAYVFERQGEDWTQTAKLASSNPVPEERMGWAVAIHDERVVIGAWGDAAYVFTRDGAGWTEESKLLATVDPPSFNLFGWSVAVSGDEIAVGSRLDDDRAIEGGAVYFY